MKKDRLQFGLFLVVIVTAFYVVERYDVFGPENIILWQEWIASLGWIAPIGFVAIYTAGAMFFLPGTIFTLLGGAAFGVFWGSVLGVIGATAGAVAAHWVARLFGKTTVDEIAEKRFKKIIYYNDRIEANGFLTVLLLRITPLIPYNGLNFALAYSPVKMRDYTLATAIGITPGVIAYVYLGEAVASLSTGNIVLAGVGIGVYMLLTWLLAKRLKTPTNKNKKIDP